MKLDDVMTTQEAGERWNVPADSIKQCCLKDMQINNLPMMKLESRAKIGL